MTDDRMTNGPSLHLHVFSYGRGRFLEHCVASIERCAPWARVTVVDDRSDDAETVAALERIATRHEVRVRPPDADGASKYGGLYPNMQAAYEAADEDEVVCFLQDDMQLVRGFEPDEAAKIGRLAIDGPRFVHPCFLKGVRRHRHRGRIHFDETLGAYLMSHPTRGPRAFSAVCALHVGSMREAGWSFVVRESRNEANARRMLAPLAFLRDPFTHWLPNPPAFRWRHRSLAIRIAERRRDCDFHPLEEMDEAERSALLERDAAVLPYAEDFLRPVGRPVAAPWIYHPLQGSRLLTRLNRLETTLRRPGGG